MAWLDRDRTPVRFTVATSVTSGVIVAAISGVFRSDAPRIAILLWFVGVAAGVAVISWGAITTIRRIRKRSRRAFMMTSAFTQKYYVAALVQRLHGVLDRDGIDMVLKVPDRDYDASAQSHNLDRLLERRHEYLGGIIIAAEVDRLRDDLTTFCHTSRLPVVFTDLEPFDDEADYPDNSTFVGYDTGEIGDLAGGWLVKRLRGKKRPRVLVIASRDHSARQTRCVEVLRRELTDVLVTVDDTCGFSRSRAHDAVRSHVRQLDPRARLHAIFCTNDEMALGAVDALATASPATQDTVIIGVDGVQEAKALIDAANSPLRATVEQDTHRLAVAIVDRLAKMRRGRSEPKRTILNADVYEAG
jgi:ribose transport system substrate-binding protein